MNKISMTVGIRTSNAGATPEELRAGQNAANYVYEAVTEILHAEGLKNFETVSSKTGEPVYADPFVPGKQNLIDSIVKIGVMSMATVESLPGKIISVQVYPAERLFDRLTYHADGVVEEQLW